MTTEPTPAETEPIPVFDKAPTSKKPKFFVAGDTFYAQTTQGELRMPLVFKTKLLRTIRKSDAADEIDQLFALLEGIGDQSTLETLDELDVFETTDLAMAYFQAWQEKHEARLGDLQRSSS